MANYLYNGVELPALPQWDRKTYPYGTLYYLVSKNQYKLYATAVTGVYQTPTDSVITGYNKVVQFGSSSSEPKISGTLTDGVWEYKDGSGLYIAVSKKSGTVLAEIVWSNYDILDSNGAVYLASSYPIDVATGAEILDYDPNTPVPEEPAPLDPKSMLMGWLVGRRIRQQPKSLVAYSYNGVLRPPLPEEWDKEKYPYAVILSGGNELGMYSYAFFFSSVEYVVGNDGSRYIKVGTDDLVCNVSGYSPEELLAGWGALYKWDRDHEYKIANITWANFDVLNADGSVFLEATEPVPVYA